MNVLLAAPLLLASTAAPAQVATQGSTQTGPAFSARELRTIERLSPLPPPPPDPTNRVADDPRAARLGQFLFFDTRLSATGEVSCATCHEPERGFTDGKSLAEIGGVRGPRHTPTLENVAHQRWFFWDGRADSLWAQALQPLENPIEMASSRLAVAHVIHRDEALHAAYEAVFGPLPELADAARFPAEGRPVDDPEHSHAVAWSSMAEADRRAVDSVFANVGKAIAAYERRLVRGDAPFDRFVAELRDGHVSKQAVLDDSAVRGLALFVGRGRCVLCHAGPALSDLEFHNTSAPPLDGGDPTDAGRYAGAVLVAASPFNAAGPHSDEPEGAAATRVRRLRGTSETWGEFKTPSLRNLVGRGPYMHQGQFATLTEVIDFYSTLEGAAGRSHHQERILVPLRLDEGEAADLLAFLTALTGAPLPSTLLAPPDSPLLAMKGNRDGDGH